MKIMFICTGNICRSAMAHRLLEKKLKDLERKDIQVYSAGIFAYDGDGSPYNAIEVMKEYNVDLITHKATNIKNSDLENMDLILCATKSHKNELLDISDKLKDKVYTLIEYIEPEKEEINIADPWGYNLETYRNCASIINNYIDKLIEKLN